MLSIACTYNSFLKCFPVSLILVIHLSLSAITLAWTHVQNVVDIVVTYERRRGQRVEEGVLSFGKVVAELILL